MAKLTVSFEWLSSCSGCEVGIVDLHEKLLAVLDDIEIVRMPILVGEREYPKATLGVVTGALRTEHDLECAEKMRKSCEKVLAFGTCAVFGGPQGSGYAHSLADLEKSSFVDNPTTSTHFVPDQGVPKLLDCVRPLDSAIDVDQYLPGCPPHPYYIFEALRAVAHGSAPEFGGHNVCFHCERQMKHTEVDSVRREFASETDPKTCFLSQGVLCMGSATLDRCLSPCPSRGAPCSGCAGPSEAVVLEPNRDVRTEVADRAAKLTKIPRAQLLREIEKQAKTFYAYGMASPVFRCKPTFLLRRWIAEEGVHR